MPYFHCPCHCFCYRNQTNFYENHWGSIFQNKVVKNVFMSISYMYVWENLFFFYFSKKIIHIWTGIAKVDQNQPCSSPFLHIFKISRFLCRLLFVFIWKISRDCGSANLHESVPLSSQNNSKRALFNPTTFSPKP